MKAEDIAAVQKLLQRPKPGKASECRDAGPGRAGRGRRHRGHPPSSPGIGTHPLLRRPGRVAPCPSPAPRHRGRGPGGIPGGAPGARPGLEVGGYGGTAGGGASPGAARGCEEPCALWSRCGPGTAPQQLRYARGRQADSGRAALVLCSEAARGGIGRDEGLRPQGRAGGV